MKCFIGMLVFVMVVLGGRHVFAVAPETLTDEMPVKVWITFGDDGPCIIDMKRLFMAGMAAAAAVKSPKMELWVEGRPVGLTLQFRVSTKYDAALHICAASILIGLVYIETADFASPTHLVEYGGSVHIPVTAAVDAAWSSDLTQQIANFLVVAIEQQASMIRSFEPPTLGR